MIIVGLSPPNKIRIYQCTQIKKGQCTFMFILLVQIMAWTYTSINSDKKIV